MQSTAKWAANEFGDAALGDVRRTKRLVRLAAEVASRPAGTVTGACASSAAREGAFRLLENASVKADALRRCVQRAAVGRCTTHTKVVVPVDSTSLQLTDRKSAKGLGSVGTFKVGARGVLVMTAFAVAESGLPLGIASQQMWIREKPAPRNFSGGARYGGESVRWLETLNDARVAFAAEAPSVRPWYQIDRGGDCWQVLMFGAKADLLMTVRAIHDRSVDAPLGRLWQAVESTRILARRQVGVPARRRRRKPRRFRHGKRLPAHAFFPAMPARRARVSIRAAAVPVVLSSPEGSEIFEFNAVLVREETNAEDPVEWMLLTTHPIRTRAEVLEVVRGYTLRWRIEDFHRTWKRGLCRVEQTQLRSRAAIEKWATILAAVAARAMKLTHQARETPDVPASTELTPYELEALIALRDPPGLDDREPTLGEAVRWLADLGGYAGLWNGPPGVAVIGRGLHDVQAAARAFESRARRQK